MGGRWVFYQRLGYIHNQSSKYFHDYFISLSNQPIIAIIGSSTDGFRYKYLIKRILGWVGLIIFSFNVMFLFIISRVFFFLGGQILLQN